MDEFQFGDPAKRWGRVGQPRHARSWLSAPVAWVLAAMLVVAGVLAFVFLTGADEAPGDPSAAVSPVDRAHDAAAQGTIGRAVVVAQTAHAELGTFPSDVATLSAADPALTFTAEPSADPTSVSYAVGEHGFAAAVRSESGTCWWVRIDAAGAISYGSGSSCTGDAAMAASDPTW